MSNQEIVRVEQEIERYKQQIDFGKAIERLYANSDFKRVILINYLENEALRLVHSLSEPSVNRTDRIQSVYAEMGSIARLNDYLRSGLVAAEAAKEYLDEAEDVRAELLEDQNDE